MVPSNIFHWSTTNNSNNLDSTSRLTFQMPSGSIQFILIIALVSLNY